MSLYLIPHRPSLNIIDPTGLYNSGEQEVQQWDVFTALLIHATEKLEAMEEVAKISV